MNFYRDIPIDPREKRRLLAVFAIATGLLIGIGVVLFSKYSDVVSSREWVRHTYDVLLDTKDVFSSLQDMETGQRGYLLTGEDYFLEPYREANTKLDAKINQLSSKVGDNPDRLRQLGELKKVVQSHRTMLKQQIVTHDRSQRDRVLTVKEAETSKATMDHLRSLTTQMVEDEKKLLDQRYTREQEERQSFLRILLFCVLLSLLALVVTNGLIVQGTLRRRNIELALQHTQQFSSTIVNQSPDCIKLLDLDGNILSMNIAGAHLMETDDVAGFHGKSWPKFWEGTHHKLAKHALDAARKGHTSRFEGQAPTAKGHVRWWEVVATPVKDDAGHIIQLLVISRDITDRYEADQIVRENEARFRQMADTLPQMVWITRADGFHEYYNNRWYEFTGVPDGSTDGEGWNGMFHPEDQPKALARWKHSLDTGEPYEIEYRLRRADGVYCWTLGRALPVRDQYGHITRWYGTCTVIEDQKRKEIELQEAKDQAEAANRAKMEFLANMSHEIRTPMNAVVGLSNLLSNSNLTADKRKEFIKTIQLSAQQLMELINDLLDVSKLDSGNVELEKISFNLAELLEEIISVMGVKAREKNIELMVKYLPELNGNFIGDPLRLRQVLMNLVSNAIKFTEKGMVTLQADYCKNDQGYWDVCFDVIDTGIGIAPAKVGTIFSKFSQADTSITRKYGGTGLGLSICKTLVELMGGTVEVVSTEGLGSKFSVALPLKPADGVPIKIKNRRPMAGVSKKVDSLPADQQKLVLLVEDYKANILVATQTIEDCGYRWELAEDGEAAIDKVKSGVYDVILMDVQMPKLDGISATIKIREWEKKNNRPRTPIIGITAYSMDGDREKCRKAGMDDYLSKPFNPEDLKEKIHTSLAKVES